MKPHDVEMVELAGEVADEVWEAVQQWQQFARDRMGVQCVEAADSVGANIAESWGRFHAGERLLFLYYARGSLYETKFWLIRAYKRGLMSDKAVEQHAKHLNALAHYLNTLAETLRETRRAGKSSSRAVREEQAPYRVGEDILLDEPLINETALAWLASVPSQRTAS
jgi:four helix bundle protein